MSVENASDQPFGSVARQMNKIVDQLSKGYYNFCPAETWTPSVNLYENGTAYLVCVDLAGVDKSKIDITVQNQRLTLKGHRMAPTPAEGEHASVGPGDARDRESQGRLRIHLMEIDHGGFSREVELPADVAADRITARHSNGLLWIELPKK